MSAYTRDLYSLFKQEQKNKPVEVCLDPYELGSRFLVIPDTQRSEPPLAVLRRDRSRNHESFRPRCLPTQAEQAVQSKLGFSSCVLFVTAWSAWDRLRMFSQQLYEGTSYALMAEERDHFTTPYHCVLACLHLRTLPHIVHGRYLAPSGRLRHA